MSYGAEIARIKVNNGPVVEFEKFFTTALPGDTIIIEILDEELAEPYVDNGNIIAISKNKWNYILPETTGTYNINLRRTDGGKETNIVVFALRSLSEQKGEYLNGYRVGNYPPEKFKGKNSYIVPKGLIEVTKENKDNFISPHFQLKQFLCKQQSGWPKYVLIDPMVIAKLEYLADSLIASGKELETIHIMSGYRTPYYNKAIGNVKYSRHIYGDAVDIYVDTNMDNVIDDLDNDGNNNIQDAVVIYNILDAIDRNPEYSYLVGGLGKYKKNSAHTYFVHTDTRGYKARW
jgi:hypothetical protein